MNTSRPEACKSTEKKSSVNVLLIFAVCYLFYICFELAKGLAFDAEMPPLEKVFCVLAALAFFAFSVWKALSAFPCRKGKTMDEMRTSMNGEPQNSHKSITEATCGNQTARKLDDYGDS